MTAAENLAFRARQNWESRMKDVFREVAPTESSRSSSDTSTVSEGEIPMPRSRRERPIRVIRGHYEDLAED